MKILTLDLGTTTGWAMQNAYGSISSGTEQFASGRFEGGGMRFLRFLHWLENINQLAHGLQAIYFEEVRRHAGVDAAHVYGGFLAQLTAWCEYERLPYAGVPVSTIKKFIAGKGNASKTEVIEAVKKLGHRPIDHNAADALALLEWALKQTNRRIQ